MELFQEFVSWIKGVGEDLTIPKDKKVTFTASADLMDEELFWKIIEAARSRSEDDFDYMYRELEKGLLQLTPDEIMLFANRFRFLRGKANTWDLWGVASIISGGCEEKGFREFREWLIGQGREFYYATLHYPESIADLDRDKVENIDWEGLGNAPARAFKELTEQEMPEPFEENLHTIGAKWLEETNDLENRFPKLFAIYSTEDEQLIEKERTELITYLIEKAYTAFNSRDIENALTTFHPKIDWPKAFEGGYVSGHEEIRAYWTRQWTEINPMVEPVKITPKDDGTVEVTVHQLVKDLEYNLIFDGMVKHIYTLEDDLLRKMDIETESVID